MGILMFGDSIIDTSDIVEIEEKTIHFSVKYSVPNPQKKPKGFFSGLMYSETIDKYKSEDHFCLVLKVKGGVQMRGQVNDCGNVSMRSNQLYDFYTICNSKRLVELVQKDINSGNTDSVCEIGNFFVYFGVLAYPDYLKTNVIIDETIMSKKDFIEKYM